MSFTVNDVYSNMSNYFSQRTIPQQQCWENTRKVVLELTEDYKFPGLEQTGPTVQFQPNQTKYSPNYFLQPADVGLDVEKFDSFFIYYAANTAPVPNQTNSGIQMKYRTINDIEILINISGLPLYWTRHEGQVYIAMTPNSIYYTYLRYQKEHPFPGAGTANAGLDPILLPNNWQDIVEYATAMRLASDFNLDDRRNKFYNTLYGDPKFRATGGTEGAPGIIFMRTSQQQRDQTTTTKSIRLMMRPVMR